MSITRSEEETQDTEHESKGTNKTMCKSYQITTCNLPARTIWWQTRGQLPRLMESAITKLEFQVQVWVQRKKWLPSGQTRVPFGFILHKFLWHTVQPELQGLLPVKFIDFETNKRTVKGDLQSTNWPCHYSQWEFLTRPQENSIIEFQFNCQPLWFHWDPMLESCQAGTLGQSFGKSTWDFNSSYKARQ